MARPASHLVVMVPYALIGANALNEARAQLFGAADAPRSLLALQLLMATASIIVVVGVWTRAWWTVRAILAWGVIAAGMLMLLEPILQLGPEVRPGMAIGAAILAFMAIATAWFIRRSTAAPERSAGPR